MSVTRPMVVGSARQTHHVNLRLPFHCQEADLVSVMHEARRPPIPAPSPGIKQEPRILRRKWIILIELERQTGSQREQRFVEIIRTCVQCRLLWIHNTDKSARQFGWRIIRELNEIMSIRDHDRQLRVSSGIHKLLDISCRRNSPASRTNAMYPSNTLLQGYRDYYENHK